MSFLMSGFLGGLECPPVFFDERRGGESTTFGLTRTTTLLRHGQLTVSPPWSRRRDHGRFAFFAKTANSKQSVRRLAALRSLRLTEHFREAPGSA
ncbi:hypothetical protein ACFPOA_09705 [Lysobacter niabensis]|uniref:hypothetical protein n=1 Tax=Agrilutibacter niabensis TaxID=380628 RepID=UPI00360C78D1